MPPLAAVALPALLAAALAGCLSAGSGPDEGPAAFGPPFPILTRTGFVLDEDQSGSWLTFRHDGGPCIRPADYEWSITWAQQSRVTDVKEVDGAAGTAASLEQWCEGTEGALQSDFAKPHGARASDGNGTPVFEYAFPEWAPSIWFHQDDAAATLTVSMVDRRDLLWEDLAVVGCTLQHYAMEDPQDAVRVGAADVLDCRGAVSFTHRPTGTLVYEASFPS